MRPNYQSVHDWKKRSPKQIRLKSESKLVEQKLIIHSRKKKNNNERKNKRVLKTYI